MALKAEEEKANKTKAAGADVDTETGDEGGETDPKLVKLVNQAVTGQLKRAMRGHADTLSSLLDEKLAALKPNGTGAAPEAKDRTKDKSSDGAPAANEELEQLRAEMAAQKKKLADQELRALEKEAYADVKAQLQGKVRPEALDMAVKLLRADGAIKLDVKKGTYAFKGPEGELLDIEEGIAEWLKGDGALFVLQQPAPGARPKPKLSAPVRAPARLGGGSNNDNLTPAQRTANALAAKGLSLN